MPQTQQSSSESSYWILFPFDRFCDPYLKTIFRLMMEDLCDMFERVDRPCGDEWAWKALAHTFRNPPVSDPTQWRQFYSKETMDRCLARINRIFFKEEIVSFIFLKRK